MAAVIIRAMPESLTTRRSILIGAGSFAIASFPLLRARADEAFAEVLDALFSRYLHIGDDGINRVAYGAWKANGADLAKLAGAIDQASHARPSKLAAGVAFAYWTNLYNALTLKIVLDNYPVRSIREIKSTGAIFDLKAGPWRTRLVAVEGRRLSLDDIEHGIMRPTFRDPRVHYAVNCASIGCPNLKPAAWRAETLAADLDAAAGAYVNHPRGVYNLGGGRLAVSSIYRWYRNDFGGSETGVLIHLRNYANSRLNAVIDGGSRIVEHRYDWTLNDLH